MLPTVPEPKPEDPEDVSWALSTAEAMWARGDHLEGIKWVRRAAEAASEAEDDARALQLAKAAADLAGMLSKRTSRASIDIEEVIPMSEPEPPPVPAKPAPKPPPAPKAAANVAPSPPAAAAASPPKPALGGVAKSSSTRPPAPLPSRTSQPPPAQQKGKPLGTNTGRPPSMRPGALAAEAKGPESKKDGKKTRRSRENLEAEARAAAALGANAKPPVVDPGANARPVPVADIGSTDTMEMAVPFVPHRPPRRVGGDDPTTISHVNDVKPPKRPSDDWDDDMTQNLTGDTFPNLPEEGDRLTAVGMPPADFKSTLQSFPRTTGGGKADGPGAAALSSGGTHPPATVAALLNPGGLVAPGVGGFGPSAPRPAAGDLHDPKITTSQAVRVVVWRDGTGVHVAPAGTVVSAITVDAVLVALEPNADLTAWLTQRGR